MRNNKFEEGDGSSLGDIRHGDKSLTYVGLKKRN